MFPPTAGFVAAIRPIVRRACAGSACVVFFAVAGCAPRIEGVDLDAASVVASADAAIGVLSVRRSGARMLLVLAAPDGDAVEAAHLRRDPPRTGRVLRARPLARGVLRLSAGRAQGAPRMGLAAYDGFEPIQAESMRENPALAGVIGWIARVQPAAHRLFSPAVDSVLGERGFAVSDAFYDRLAAVDRLVLGRLPGGEDLGPRAPGARSFDDDCRAVAARRIERRSPEHDQR